VLTAEELLHEDEKFHGYFTVEVARWSTMEKLWTSTVPPLYMIVTDQRLILQPQSRKRHDPAILPGSCIRRVEELHQNFRSGVLLYVSTDMILSFFVPSKDLKLLMRHLKTMTLPPSPVQFDEKIELGSLEKIITFIKTM